MLKNMKFNYLVQKTILFGLVLALSACASGRIYESRNFDAEARVFENTDGTKNNKSFTELLGLFASYFTRPDDPDEKTGFPVITSDADMLATLKDEIIWAGHSTLIVNHGGVNIMTDPIFSNRASPVQFSGPKRVTPLPFHVRDLPPIDAVVISHSHYDHLDKGAIIDLSRYQPDIQYYVPLGLKPMLESWGAKHVTEMDWWDEANVNGLKITATPVKHWSSRTPFDRNKTLWSGWMITWPDFSFYFAGDTGYSDDFKVTRARLGAPDLAAIPIGAYDPRDFMEASHINPEEAVQVLIDLEAKKAVPIHWGTFKLTLEPMAEPPVKLQKALDAARSDGQLAGQEFVILKHGERTGIK